MTRKELEEQIKVLDERLNDASKEISRLSHSNNILRCDVDKFLYPPLFPPGTIIDNMTILGMKLEVIDDYPYKTYDILIDNKIGQISENKLIELKNKLDITKKNT